jgi:hypothetical protein
MYFWFWCPVRRVLLRYEGVSKKFPDWPSGARTANGAALCHQVQLYRYFVSQSTEFCRHNPLYCFSTCVYCCKRIFHYRLSPETFGYTLVDLSCSGSCTKQDGPPMSGFMTTLCLQMWLLTCSSSVIGQPISQTKLNEAGIFRVRRSRLKAPWVWELTGEKIPECSTGSAASSLFIPQLFMFNNLIPTFTKLKAHL